MICGLFISSIANAQYRINKKKYDYRTYSYKVGDPYNPSRARYASSWIPGLGQMISGAGVRGTLFLAGTVGCSLSVFFGTGLLIENSIEDVKSNFGTTSMTIVGAIGTLALSYWSREDAVRVAKVNNLAFRDKNKTSFNLQLQPYINTTCYTQNGSIPVGATLKVTF